MKSASEFTPYKLIPIKVQADAGILNGGLLDQLRDFEKVKLMMHWMKRPNLREFEAYGDVYDGEVWKTEHFGHDGCFYAVVAVFENSRDT